MSAGLGSLASERWLERLPRVIPALAFAIVVLAASYAVVLDAATPALLGLPLTMGIGVALVITAPVGFVLGAFVPLGVRAIARQVEQPAALVAWAWAINGFFSVIGSVATTILAMAVGFRLILGVAAVTYLVACWLLAHLATPAPDFRRVR